MTLDIRRYDPSLVDDWTAVLRQSRNGLFIFDRRYMDYHASRYPDVSAVAYADGEPVANFVATMAEGTRHAIGHAGLTFGGFILARQLRAEMAMAAVEGTLDALKGWGVDRLTIKPVPLPYCTAPAQEVEYVLWRRGFILERRDVGSLVMPRANLPPSKSKARDAKRAAELGVEIREVTVDEFYPLLREVLQGRHQVDPVHSNEELRLLHSRFPERIRVLGATIDSEIVAGAVVFGYDRVWHTQYLATGEKGRAANALDLLITTLIEQACGEGVAVSLGTSMKGEAINNGLLWQKEGFGARSVVQDVMSGDV